jgi:hypothetical protein
MMTPSDGSSPDAQTLSSTARLREIADLGLNDSDIDGILSEIAAEAAAHFGLPVALVSIVLDQAQYFRGWPRPAVPLPRGPSANTSFATVHRS